jgi:hypothetical protein
MGRQARMDLAKPQSQDLCILWPALRERRLRQSIARALKCGLHQGVPGGFTIVPRRTNQPEECAILTRTQPDEMGYFHKFS